MMACSKCSSPYPSAGELCPTCGFAPPIVDGFPAWAPEMAHEGGGFKDEYFAALAPREAASFWFRGRNAVLLWALKRFFPALDSFMEVGCGTGFVLSGVSHAFPSARLVGSEIFTAGLAFAAKRVPAATFLQMDARRIPFMDEFDVVGAFDVIEHIDEDVDVLENLRRAVKRGGGVLISVPQHRWLWSAVDEYSCHFRRYEVGELHSKIERAGLTILYSTSFVSLLLPLMILSRRRAQPGKGYDPMSEFHINPLLNSALHMVMRVEHAMLRVGIRLPIGGSRLVVAQRP